jgi:hypothetical protein
MIFRVQYCFLEARRRVRTGNRFPWRLDSDPGETRGARGRRARGADFARGRGAWGADLRPRAPLPTLTETRKRGSGKCGNAKAWNFGSAKVRRRV